MKKNKHDKPDKKLNNKLIENQNLSHEKPKIYAIKKNEDSNNTNRRNFLLNTIKAGAAATLTTGLITGCEKVDEGPISLKESMYIETIYHEGLTQICISPDGKTLVSISNSSVQQKVFSHVNSKTGELIFNNETSYEEKFWTIPDGELRTTSNLYKVTKSICYSQDGTLFASGSYEDISIWSYLEKKTIRLSVKNETILSLAFSPDGKMLASGGKNVQLWSIQEAKILNTINKNSDINCMEFSPDGSILAFGSSNNIYLWSINEGTLINTLQNYSAVNDISFSPNGEMLVSGSMNIKLWSIPDGKLLKTFGESSNRVPTVSFSPDGKTLATGSSNKNFHIWSIPEGTLLGAIPEENAYYVEFSKTGTLLASGNSQGYIKLWKFPGATEIKIDSYCNCDTVCTCDTVCSCDSVCSCNNHSSGGGYSYTYWYPN